MRYSIAAVLLLVVSLGCLEVSAFVMPGSTGSNITSLKEFSQIRHMMRVDDEVFLLYFYDSVDANSLRVASLVEEAAGGLDGFVTTFGVNVRDPNVQWLVNAWGVQLLPSLKVVAPIKTHRSTGVPKMVGGIKQPIDYREKDYLPEMIRKFALQVLPSNLIQKINDEHASSLSEAVRGGENSFCVLFTDKATSSQLYRALALRFHRRVAFVEVYKQKSPNLMKQLGVKKVPTLMVFPSTKNCQSGSCTVGKAIQYDGATLQIGALIQFLEPYAHMTRAEVVKQMEADELAILAKEERKAVNPVIKMVNEADWIDEVLTSNGIVGVLFADGATDEAKEKNRILAEAKTRVERSAVTGYVFVEASKNPEMVKFFCGEDANPTIQPELVFVSVKKSVFTRFVGAFSVEGVLSFISNQLRSGSGVKKFKVDAVPKWKQN